MNPPTLLALVGPTGVGKTEVALALAPLLGAEVLSADSRQVFRRLDIGTAKPTVEQRRLVPHHLVDLIDVTESLSAGEFRRRFERAESALRERGRRALAVGGSGFYLRSVTHGLFEGPAAREDLRRAWAERPLEDLRAELARVDPVTAARLSPNDRQRNVRALEVFHATGRALSQLHAERPGASRPVRMVCLTLERQALYERINRRVDLMDAAGLEAEARWLYAQSLPGGAPARRTVGYQEWWEHFEGGATRPSVLGSIRQNTRRYAKRQMTWFRAQEGILWLQPAPEEPAASVAEKVAALLQES